MTTDLFGHPISWGSSWIHGWSKYDFKLFEADSVLRSTWSCFLYISDGSGLLQHDSASTHRVRGPTKWFTADDSDASHML